MRTSGNIMRVVRGEKIGTEIVPSRKAG
jgi:hypothetical protein